MSRHILLFGLVGGLLIAALRAIEYRWVIVQHSFEIYAALIAALFAAFGIWLGRRLTAARERVIVREVAVEVPVAVTGPFIRDDRALAASGLTPRELEVLELIAGGLSTREIAERVHVSENTVKTHSSRVYLKLGAQRRTQAVQIAKARRLIP